MRLSTYEEVAADSACVGDDWIADLEQNYPHASISTELPTLTRVCSPWSSAKARIMCGAEHLLAQGVPTYPDLVASPYRCDFLSVVQAASEATIKSMAGNSFHMPTISIIVAYAMGNVVAPSAHAPRPSFGGPASGPSTAIGPHTS